MKKFSLVLAGLMISGMASAVQLDGVGGMVMRTGDCQTLLNEDVRINLTTGVVAGVHCNTTRVAISACHTAGRKVSRSVEVVTPCDTTANPQCTDTVTVSTVQGPAMASATSNRGTVTSGYPGGDCTAATAETYATGLN